MASADRNDLVRQDVARTADRSPIKSESREVSELLGTQILFRRFATVIVSFVLLMISLIMRNLYKAASATGDEHVGVQAATTPRSLAADLGTSFVGIVGEVLVHRGCGLASSTSIAPPAVPQTERRVDIDPSVAFACKP
jgi:preprotein translocase subunit SecG